MKSNRQSEILAILRGQESITAPELATRLQVSRRTITRDIEAMSRAGIPIQTVQGSGGGIRLTAEDSSKENSVISAGTNSSARHSRPAGKAAKAQPAPKEQPGQEEPAPRFIAKVIIHQEYRPRLLAELSEDLFTQLPDGTLLVQRGFADEHSALLWVLSFDRGAEALEPLSLRNKLLSFGEFLERRYS